MTTLARRLACAALGLVLMASAACARGADAERVKADLQQRLDRDVKPDLFRVVGVKREGSAPMPAGESGAPRVVVYYNATLELVQPYKFGSWEELGSSSVAYAVGATEKGLFGLQPENKAGDRIRAYGRAIYEQSADGGWMPVESGALAPQTAATETPDIEGSAPPSRSKQLINQLAALVELPPPGRPVQEDAIIAEELSRASDNIQRRVKRREAGFTLATGPENGMYARFGGAIVAAIKQLAPAIKIQERHSEGSVDNAFLLARGEADYAIVQGDVAAAAVAGDDVFSRQPLAMLRAVGGLFPEAIHIVVRPDSPIKDVADLRGRRVNIGTPTSGTRFDALAVLAAYGLKPGDLGEARQDGPSAAIDRLRRGQIDALFATAAAPERALQAFAAQPGLRLLPITDAALEQLGKARPGLLRLTLPVNTYPRQQSAVVTAASSALLVTTADAPPAEVERVVDLVFKRMTQNGAGGADVVKVSAENQLRGVTIPLHEGAARTAPGEER